MNQTERDVFNLTRLKSTVNNQEILQSLDKAIEQMKKLIPITRLYHREEYPEHLWRRTENGEIDTSAWGYEFHSGPICERCYHSFCEQCDPDGYTKALPCVVEEFKCPTCGAKVTKQDKKCRECNQVLIPWGEK